MVPVVSVSTVLTAEALPRGVCRKKSVCEKKHRYDFHRFLRHFAVHREELHTDTESFDYILISMVWNIMAICHSLNIWNTRK